VDKKRKHTNDIQNTTYEVETMSKQDKTLTAEELGRILDYIATRNHSIRNRALALRSFYNDCRVGELRSLTCADVRNDDMKRHAVELIALPKPYKQCNQKKTINIDLGTHLY